MAPCPLPPFLDGKHGGTSPEMGEIRLHVCETNTGIIRKISSISSLKMSVQSLFIPVGNRCSAGLTSGRIPVGSKKGRVPWGKMKCISSPWDDDGRTKKFLSSW
jgi:hypothetical protein